jgi:DNA-packaging protein gp3
MAGGRPPIYDTPEQMQADIDLYFSMTDIKEVTITGLALHLGFESRQSFYDYEQKPEFSYIVKRARLRVEMGYEIKLSGNNCTGAIFALKNMGWKDKTETELSGGVKISKPSWFDDGMETKTA